MFLIALLCTVLPGSPRTASAQQANTPLEADYLANDVVAVGKDYFVLRIAFAVDGPGNRWIALDSEYRLEQAIPLVKADGQLLTKRWNSLFTPTSPRPIKWTDCRLDVDFKDLESAGNLPRDKTFVVWAMGVVLDYTTRKHVGSGWSVRAPLVVTTDADGKITDLQAPPLTPPNVRDVPAKPVKLPVLPVTAKLQHLVLKSGVQAYRTYTIKHKRPITFFVRGSQQVWEPMSFGFALEPIDSPEKALELASLQFNGGVLVKTRQQLEAIESVLRKLGWKEGEGLVIGPKSFGTVVSPVKAMGYRVQGLVIEPRPDGMLGDIAHHEMTLSTDGWIGDKRTLCVRAPLADTDRPEGWTQPAPASPQAYTQAVRKALADHAADGSATIGPFFELGDNPVRVDLPRGMPFKRFLLPQNFPGRKQTEKPSPKDKPQPDPKANDQPDKKPAPKTPQPKTKDNAKPTNSQPGQAKPAPKNDKPANKPAGK